MIDKIARRLGMKDDTGWDDPTVFGFLVLACILGTMVYATFIGLLVRFGV